MSDFDPFPRKVGRIYHNPMIVIALIVALLALAAGYEYFLVVDFRSFGPARCQSMSLHAAAARASTNTVVISCVSAAGSESGQIRWRQRARRTSAMASAKDGVVFWGYQSRWVIAGWSPEAAR